MDHDDETAAYNQGYNQGYNDGYAAGLRED